MNPLDRELLAEAVDRLPDDQREVVNALFYERASYRTVAARMGVSRYAVEMLRAKAMASLRDLIEASTEDES